MIMWFRRQSSTGTNYSSTQRNFRFLSIFGYAVILGSTWEFALVYDLKIEHSYVRLMLIYYAG